MHARMHLVPKQPPGTINRLARHAATATPEELDASNVDLPVVQISVPDCPCVHIHIYICEGMENQVR